MHNTIVKLKDGRVFIGPIRMWRPQENWLSIDDFDEGRRNATRISFDDIVSGETDKDRININTVDNIDIPERARKELHEGRMHNWKGYPMGMYSWESCQFCGKAELEVVEACEPWSCKHLQCRNCDSTYQMEGL